MRTRIYEDLADLYTLWRDTSLGEAGSEKREVQFLVNLFDAHQIKSTIDLGGGVGLHARGLTERGYDVTLFDQSEKALTIAKEHLPALKTSHGSFETINLDTTFDASICMWSTLSYVWDKKDQQHFYEWVGTHSSKLIVLDEPNFSLYPQEFHKIYTGGDAHRSIKITRDWTMENNLKRTRFLYEVRDKVTSEVTKYEDQEVQQYLTLEEMQHFLGKDWKLEKIYGDYDTNASFDLKTSPRMIFIFIPV